MATRPSDVNKDALVKDHNQLPYIDRENLFELRYNCLSLVATISQELLCAHLNLMDVAYLSEIYSGILFKTSGALPEAENA